MIYCFRTKTLLFRNKLLPVLNVQAFSWNSIQTTALEVEDSSFSFGEGWGEVLNPVNTRLRTEVLLGEDALTIPIARKEFIRSAII